MVRDKNIAEWLSRSWAVSTLFAFTLSEEQQGCQSWLGHHARPQAPFRHCPLTAGGPHTFTPTQIMNQTSASAKSWQSTALMFQLWLIFCRFCGDCRHEGHTQSSLELLHTYIAFLSQALLSQRTYSGNEERTGGNVAFRILPKDTLTCALGKLGIEPTAF